MTDKEKLITLIKESTGCTYGGESGDEVVESEIDITHEEIERIAEYLLANDVIVQKHGYWESRCVSGEDPYRCSVCGNSVDVLGYDGCPHCFSKMDAVAPEKQPAPNDLGQIVRDAKEEAEKPEEGSIATSVLAAILMVGLFCFTIMKKMTIFAILFSASLMLLSAGSAAFEIAIRRHSKRWDKAGIVLTLGWLVVMVAAVAMDSSPITNGLLRVLAVITFALATFGWIAFGLASRFRGFTKNAKHTLLISVVATVMAFLFFVLAQ